MIKVWIRVYYSGNIGTMISRVLSLGSYLSRRMVAHTLKRDTMPTKWLCEIFTICLLLRTGFT